jgi:hypothetical protein
MPIVLKCPACREKFKYDVSQGWPDECPICHTDINNRRADDDVVMPNILSFKTKNNDKVARDIMDGSEQRAEMAAALAGTPVSEMSSLKITDLNDRNDTQFAAKEVVNDVTHRMAAMQAAGMPTGFGVGPNGSEYASQAHAPVMVNGQARPIEPYAGARARRDLQKALVPVGMAPLPLEISGNPNYKARA